MESKPPGAKRTGNKPIQEPGRRSSRRLVIERFDRAELLQPWYVRSDQSVRKDFRPSVGNYFRVSPGRFAELEQSRSSEDRSIPGSSAASPRGDLDLRSRPRADQGSGTHARPLARCPSEGDQPARVRADQVSGPGVSGGHYRITFCQLPFQFYQAIDAFGGPHWHAARHMILYQQRALVRGLLDELARQRDIGRTRYGRSIRIGTGLGAREHGTVSGASVQQAYHRYR